MANRNYSSVARAATITASVSGSSTVIPVSETTGFPSVPFTMVVDPGRTAEEIITVTSQVGLSLTVVRGEDGTTAVPHDAGATLRHMATARDYRESSEHISLSNGVHGTSGSVVGDIDSQTLDNKTFSALGTDHTALYVRQGSSQSSPLVVFQEPGGQPVMSYLNSGGFISQGTQTMRPTVSSSPAVNVQGVGGQTAPLLNFKDSGGSTLSYIDAAGKFFGNVQGSVTGDVSATNLTSTNLTATNATLSSLAPILGRVPFKIRVGSTPAAILPGTTSVVVTEDISSSGFTQNPYVLATVSTNETDNDARRVGVEHLVLTGTGSVQFRVFQSAGVALGTTGNYSIQYIAIQMSSSSAAG